MNDRFRRYWMVGGQLPVVPQASVPEPTPVPPTPVPPTPIPPTPVPPTPVPPTPVPPTPVPPTPVPPTPVPPTPTPVPPTPTPEPPTPVPPTPVPPTPVPPTPVPPTPTPPTPTPPTPTPTPTGPPPIIPSWIMPSVFVITDPAQPVITTAKKAGGASTPLSGWGDGEISNEWWERIYTGMSISKAITNFRVNDIRIEQCKEFLLQESRTNYLTNALIQRCFINTTKRAFYFRGATTATVYDLEAHMVGGPQIGDAPTGASSTFPVAIQVGQKDEGYRNPTLITLERGKISGFHTNWGSGEYNNGGGIVAESGDGPLRVHDYEIWDCTEPVDFKMQWDVGSMLIRDSTRHFKVWGSGHANWVQSVNPVKKFAGSGATCDILAQGVSDVNAEPPVYVFERFDFLGDVPRKHISIRGGAYGKIIIKSSNLTKAQLTIEGASSRMPIEMA